MNTFEAHQKIELLPVLPPLIDSYRPVDLQMQIERRLRVAETLSYGEAKNAKQSTPLFRGCVYMSKF